MVTVKRTMASDTVYRAGYHRAPARAYLRAIGLTDEDISKPCGAVASAWNEATPCNVHLTRLAGWAKEGVKAAGGTPREFATIAVSDGIAMGYEGMKASLVSREVIADSVELMMMARLNVPSVFLYGGTIKPGQYRGQDVTIQDVFEGVGAVEAGRMSEQELYDLECAACPGEGSCGGMYTANTMARASEALGMALLYSASIPAADPARQELCRLTGDATLLMLERNIRPRDILTRKAFENAITIVVAIGGSTNACLHLPALAHAGGPA